MRVLIVGAHPDPESFSRALADVAERTLRAAGHQLEVSDLYAMGWDPVIMPDNTSTSRSGADRFDPSREQEAAWLAQTLPADVRAEQAKLVAADLVILHFPIWWYSMPAILKGWVDRVFGRGFAYSRGCKYGHGRFVGKKAMLCITTGTASTLYEPNGIDGDLYHVLWPIHNGILAYTGFTVVEPYVAWMPGSVSPRGRAAYLSGYERALREVESRDVLYFHPWEDYDEHDQLKPGVVARSGVQWNPRAGQSREDAAADRYRRRRATPVSSES